MSRRTAVEEYRQFGIKLRCTPGHRQIIDSIRDSDLTFVTGDAGTGKSYISIAESIYRVLSDTCKQHTLVYVRPAVQSQEDLGYMPGSHDEKVEPYMGPFWSNVSKLVSPKHVQMLRRNGEIQLRTIAFLRGLTFSDSMLVLDEAQNTTRKQMELLLTRAGRGTKIVVIGDTDQKDISGCGLEDAIDRFCGLSEVSHVTLGPEDNMRSPLVKKIVEGYRNNIDTPISSEERWGSYETR